jgi:DNA-directed RNA polymerase specialized sigma24 family protein
VPGDLWPKVSRLLERAWRDDPSVEVVVDRRVGERRTTGERRRASMRMGPPFATDRRQIRYEDGRRIADRRAILVPVAGPELPRAARRHADRIVFLEPLASPPEFLEAIDVARTVTRLQSGDEQAIEELYTRYFDRIYTYLRVTLKRSAEAEERTAEVFVRMIKELPRLALRAPEITPWVFGLAYQAAVALPVEAIGPVPEVADADAHLGADDALEWLTDDDLQLLIERRPVDERHLLMLRYMAGLGFTEIGAILGMSAREAVELHRAAVDALDASLAAITRSPRVGGRHHMRRLTPSSPTPVLHRRRRALQLAA